MELLELTLNNLKGGTETEAFRDKWVLINSNQIWAKKLCSLVNELVDLKPDLPSQFKCIETI